MQIASASTGGLDEEIFFGLITQQQLPFDHSDYSKMFLSKLPDLSHSFNILGLKIEHLLLLPARDMAQKKIERSRNNTGFGAEAHRWDVREKIAQQITYFPKRSSINAITLKKRLAQPNAPTA